MVALLGILLFGTSVAFMGFVLFNSIRDSYYFDNLPHVKWKEQEKDERRDSLSDRT